MRADKLTTAFQQALGDAQSLAVARDNPYIEPAHVLAAMLQQPDGTRRCSTEPAPTPRLSARPWTRRCATCPK